MRAWIGRVVMVVVAVGLASCGNDRDVTDDVRRADTQAAPKVEHRVAVDPGAVGPPGTEIAPGVEVVAGSSQIGPTFPLLGWTKAGERMAAGWQAVVVVDAEPVEVWNGYVRQFDIDDRASAREACTVSRRGSPQQVAPTPAGHDQSDPTRFLTEPAIDGEDRIECLARVGQIELTMMVGQDGCDLWQGTEIPPECLEREIAHLLIQVQTHPQDQGLRSIDGSLGTDQLRFERTVDPYGEGGRDRLALIPPGEVVPPQFGAAQPSRLPAPGERIDDGLDSFLDDFEDLPGGLATVPNDGTSLMAPAMLQFCNSGLVAILSLPALPEQAVQSFAVDSDEETLTLGGEADPAWAELSTYQLGGFGLDLLAVAQPDGSSAVLVTECGD